MVPANHSKSIFSVKKGVLGDKNDFFKDVLNCFTTTDVQRRPIVSISCYTTSSGVARKSRTDSGGVGPVSNI